MDSISTSARVSSKTVISKMDGREHYKKGKTRKTGEVSLPDSAPPVQGTGDSGQVLALPPNRTATASRASFGGIYRPLSPHDPKLFGTLVRLILAAAPLPRNHRIANGTGLRQQV